MKIAMLGRIMGCIKCSKQGKVSLTEDLIVLINCVNDLLYQCQ